MRYLSHSLLFAITSTFSLSAAALQAGDVAVIGIHTDAPDKTAFVALVNLPAGTSISLTD